jgi:hypothetical protein
MLRQEEPQSVASPPPPPPPRRRLGQSAVAAQVVPPHLPPRPNTIVASYTIYDSDTDRPLASLSSSSFPLLHESNNWTVHQELYLDETGPALNVRFELDRPVHHVSYYWDGERHDRKDRFAPHFSGRYNTTDGDIVAPFAPLRDPGNHTLTVRTMRSATETLQDLTIHFHIFQAKQYLERVVINAGVDDEPYLSHPDRSYSLDINNDHAIKVGNAQEYNLTYFQTLRKSEYRGNGSLLSSSEAFDDDDDDFPILYGVSGLRPNALHRVTVGFVETEPAYCHNHDNDAAAVAAAADVDGPQQQETAALLYRKSYFIFCNGGLFDHAYDPLQYVECDTAHLAHGYFLSTEEGTLTVALLSKFHPFETTVALVDIELY